MSTVFAEIEPLQRPGVEGGPRRRAISTRSFGAIRGPSAGWSDALAGTGRLRRTAVLGRLRRWASCDESRRTRCRTPTSAASRSRKGRLGWGLRKSSPRWRRPAWRDRKPDCRRRTCPCRVVTNVAGKASTLGMPSVRPRRDPQRLDSLRTATPTTSRARSESDSGAISRVRAWTGPTSAVRRRRPRAVPGRQRAQLPRRARQPHGHFDGSSGRGSPISMRALVHSWGPPAPAVVLNTIAGAEVAERAARRRPGRSPGASEASGVLRSGCFGAIAKELPVAAPAAPTASPVERDNRESPMCWWSRGIPVFVTTATLRRLVPQIAGRPRAPAPRGGPEPRTAGR
jgi:hypothetical protein